MAQRPVAIMQGRLSPPVGRLPVFPWSSWEDEFLRARDAGFDAIEWLFEAERFDENPLWTPQGCQRIRACVERTGVRVGSVCANYFMVRPFFRAPEGAVVHAVEILETLVRHAADEGITTIVLPVLETGEIRTDLEQSALLDAIRGPLDLAAPRGVRLAIEAELPVARYRALVQAADHPACGICYDTGNAVAQGFDTGSDLRQLGPYLMEVHLKDRTQGGHRVPLGRGNVDFGSVFAALDAVGYAGPLVIESTSSDEFLLTASNHLAFVRTRQGIVGSVTR